MLTRLEDIGNLMTCEISRIIFVEKLPFQLVMSGFVFGHEAEMFGQDSYNSLLSIHGQQHLKAQISVTNV